MKTFEAFFLIEPFLVSVFNFQRILNPFQGRMGLLPKQHGMKTVLMLPPLTKAENQKESGSRVDMY